MEDNEDSEKKTCDIYSYSFPSKNRKVSRLDIGVDSIFDISVSDRNETSIRRRKMKQRRTGRKFTIFSPSIPLCAPNKSKVIRPYDFCKTVCSTNYRHLPKSREHYSRLKDEYTGIFHASLLRIPGFKHTINSFVHDSKIDYQCPVGLNFLAKKNLPRIISDYISDIPKLLLLGLFDEALLGDFEEFEENNNLKNCLAFCVRDERLFTFCPAGQLMDVIRVEEILLDTEEMCDDEKPERFNMIKSKEYLNKHVGFLIKEMTFQNMLYVRGNYCCHIFYFDYGVDNNDLILAHEINFQKMVHSIGMNPYSPEEMFIATDDRSIFWYPDLSQSADILDNPFSKNVKWQTCIYGQSRETCLVSNEDDISMYDFRTKNAQTHKYLDISCEYFDKMENFSPVLQWNPSNKHQYFTATNQSLIMGDERYLKTPLTQVNHYLNSPPRFMQTHSSVSDFLVFLGSYRSAESVMIQFCSNGVQEVFCGSGKLSCKNPWKVDQPLYKLSNYSDWKSYISDWRIMQSSTDRLSQPCIGLMFSSLEPLCNTGLNYYLFLQQSLCGDLFFQQMVSDICEKDVRAFQTVTLTRSSNSYENSLIETCNAKCNDWLDYITDSKVKPKSSPKGFDNPLVCHSSLSSNVEKGESSFQEIDTFEFKDLWTYRNVGIDKFSEEIIDCCKLEECIAHTKDDMVPYDINCFCKSCGDNYLKKLSKLRNDSKIVTRESLGVKGIHDVQLDNGYNLQRSERPLNNLFDAQWDKNDYTPLEEFAPNVAFDESGFDND